MAREICLNWNNHASILKEFKNFLSSNLLVDVTLACDGKILKAHKVILSACSPFFQSLFSDNPCKHPIVMVQDVKFSELKAVVDFMYDGEVNVTEDRLAPLIKAAESLKVKVLGDVMIAGDESENHSGYESELQSAAVSRIQSEDESEPPSGAVSRIQTDDESEPPSTAASRIQSEDESEILPVIESALQSAAMIAKVTPPKRRRGRPRKRTRGYLSDGGVTEPETEPETEQAVLGTKTISGDIASRPLDLNDSSELFLLSHCIKSRKEQPLEGILKDTRSNFVEPMVIDIGDDDDEEEKSKK